MSKITPPADKPDAEGEATIPAWTSESATLLEELIAEPGFCTNLAKSKDRSEFKQLIQGVVKHLGFTDFGFLRMADVDDMGGWLFTLPQELLETYHHNVYHEQEYVWQFLTKENRPIYCADMYEWAGTAQFSARPIQASLAVYKLIKSFNYSDAYCLPLQSSDAEHWVVFLVLAQGMPIDEFREKVASCERALSLLGQAIEHTSRTHFPEFFAGSKETRAIAMTPASLEVMRTMVMQQLSVKQTAAELGIGARTVVRHLAAIKRELGVNTLLEAVDAALRQGIFDNRTYH